MSILTLETKKYSIKIDNFEGPLDLLCYLIDKNKMNIYDVNLTEITNQYIEYLNAMEEMNLEIASEFNGINIVIFKIQKLVTKTRRGRRRNNRRGTYKKNYWVQEI